ncbi:MAG TPA: hypothetical protein PKL97_06555 [Candidatus Omnitrophota bacterium]|nr:hypothetical protein [Candidatus Omnitrophota bacterium]
MRKFQSVFFLCVFIVTTLPVPYGYPADENFADTTAGKASKELLESTVNFFNDMAEMKNMSDKQRLEYILSKGKERIWEKTIDKSWDAMKDKITEYAQARIREDLFKSQVAAMMHKCVVEGQSVAAVWSQVDTDIAPKVLAGMNAVKTALAGADVLVDAYKEWQKGGIDEGIKALKVKAAEKIIEYFIPGWGYYRLAQALVEALCQYIVAYAFDAALEAKLKAILPIDRVQNPKGFEQWLVGTDVVSYVNTEWEEQIGVTGWYFKYDGDDKTQDEFGDNMKTALIQKLSEMKDDIMKKHQIEAEMKVRIQAEEAKTAEAARAIKALAGQAMQGVQPYIDMIDSFKENIYGYRKQDVQQKAAQVQREYEQAVATSPKEMYQYKPFDKSSILSALEAAYSEVTDTFSKGYDLKKAAELLEHYKEVRAKAAQDNERQFEEPLKKLSDMNQEYQKESNAHWLSHNKVWYEEEQREIQLRWLQKMTPIGDAVGQMRKLQQADWATLPPLEEAIRLEAAGRNQKMVDELYEGMQKIQGEVDQAIKAYEASMTEWNNKISGLNYPDQWNYPSETSLPGMGDMYPSSLVKTIEPMEIYRKNLAADAQTAASLEGELKKILADYRSAYESAKGDFESLVQKPYREYDEYMWKANIDITYYNDITVAPLQQYRTSPRLNFIRTAGELWVDADKKWPSRAGYYEKALAQTDKILAQLRDIMPSAELAVQYWRLLDLPELIPYEKDQLKARGIDSGNLESWFRRKDGKADPGVKPEDSDGVKLLDEVKAIWERNKARIETLKDLRRKFESAAVMKFRYEDPRDDKLLSQYEAIPDLIRDLEKELANARKKYRDLIDSQPKTLKNFEDEYARASGMTDFYRKDEELRKLQGKVSGHLGSLDPYQYEELLPSKEQFRTLQKKIDGEIASTQFQIEGLGRGAAGAVGGSSGGGQTGSGLPAGAPGGGAIDVTERVPDYTVRNVFLNGKSFGNLSGEAVLARDDLKGGRIELNGGLSTMHRVEKLAISDDGGATWHDLKREQGFAYSFNPVAEKRYEFILKIWVEGASPVELRIFNNLSGVVFRDIDYTKLVLDAVKNISDAYEKQNIGLFSEYISRDFAANRSALEEGVRFDFQMFAEIRLSLYINRIERRGDLFIVDIKWDKTQTPRKQGEQQKTSGQTTFTFIYEDGKMKIRNLRGSLIYATLSPEMAEASGLGQKAVEEIRKAREEGKPVQPGSETPEAGGGKAVSKIQTGSFTLSAKSFAHGDDPVDSFIFSTASVVHESMANFSGDFRRRDGFVEPNASGGILDLGSMTLNSVSDVPTSGYQGAFSVSAAPGHSYAVKLSNGTYAVVEVTSETCDPHTTCTTQCRYKYQPDGTPSMKSD